MHPRTPELARSVRTAPNLERRLELLHNVYEGTRCVIVTCGPSLASVPTNRLRAALDGVLTISVKQAILNTAEHTDFLCFNSYNVSRFRTPSSATMRCIVAEPSGLHPQFNRPDLVFRQSSDSGDLGKSLAVTEDFTDFPLARGPERPWGPGIMYALVLHLAVHLGASEIVTLGWDIADSRGVNSHFYDSTEPPTEVPDRSDQPGPPERSALPTALRRARSSLPLPVKRAVRLGRAATSHVRGSTYNRAVLVDGETEAVGASTAAANAWLAESGVTLEVITPSEHLDPSIRRLTLEEFFTRSGA